MTEKSFNTSSVERIASKIFYATSFEVQTKAWPGPMSKFKVLDVVNGNPRVRPSKSDRDSNSPLTSASTKPGRKGSPALLL